MMMGEQYGSYNGEKVAMKEISKDIILHKIQRTLTNANDGAESKYTFRIVSNSIKEVDFVADFTGSENVRIEGGPPGSA